MELTCKEKILSSKGWPKVTIPVASADTLSSPWAGGSANQSRIGAVVQPPGILGLLQPHTKSLALGVFAVVGEGVANLLEPWPLKLVFDNVGRLSPTHGWLSRWIQSFVGQDKIAVLEIAAAAVLCIALLDAVCFYTEKYLTTSVGQWVMHDLRRLLYAHIQDLSLAYHNQKQTGELISRLTSDIDAIQSFMSPVCLDSW